MIGFVIAVGVIVGVAGGYGAWQLALRAISGIRRWWGWRGVAKAHRKQRIELRRMRRNSHERSGRVGRS